METTKTADTGETQTLDQKSAKLRDELSQFTGTNAYYRHPLARSFLYTDGVRHFAENAGNGAYWLLDILATERKLRVSVNRQMLIFAKLRVNRRNSASNSCEADLIVYEDVTDEGDGFTGVSHMRHLEYTDCPPGEWDFYLGLNDVDGRPVVIACLPSEN